MSPGDGLALLQTLLTALQAAVGAVLARAAALLGQTDVALPAGVPAWAPAGMALLVLWALAEALSGVLKLLLRVAAVALAVAIALRVLG